MRRRKLLLFAAFGLALALSVGWTWWRTTEPAIRGHPLTYWIFPGLQHPKASPEAVAAAFAEMDERCVRFLVRELNWKPSALNKALNAAANGRLDVHFGDREDLRCPAALALAQLGPRATSAISALERCVRQGVEPHAEVARGAALAALIQLRHDPLTQLLEKLRDPSDPEWTVHALAARDLGSNAAATAPVLAKALSSTTNFNVRGYAAWALASVQGPPEVTLPALRAVLGDGNEWIRRSAALGLGNLGPVARPAWAELVPLLCDTDWGVRFWTTNALRQIDPEAARQLGLD